MPPPNAVSSCCAMGWEGIRMPTLFCPPVTMSLTFSPFGKISVSGPGQNIAASRSACGGIAETQRCR